MVSRPASRTIRMAGPPQRLAAQVDPVDAAMKEQAHLARLARLEAPLIIGHRGAALTDPDRERTTVIPLGFDGLVRVGGMDVDVLGQEAIELARLFLEAISTRLERGHHAFAPTRLVGTRHPLDRAPDDRVGEQNLQRRGHGIEVAAREPGQ